MKFIACILLLLCAYHATAVAESPNHARSFFLEGVRSGRLYGPFVFQTGTTIQLDTGEFRIDVLSAAGAFILTEQQSGTVFGVYELVPGRMIDAGYQLFTITRVSTQPLASERTARPFHESARHAPQDTHPSPFYNTDYRIGIVFDLINQIAYDWKLDGEDGDSAKYIERRGATLTFSRGIVTLKAGALLDGSWEETIDAPDGAFEDGTLTSGTGWKAGLSLLVPVFVDGRWSAAIGGGVTYQRETFDLEFGQWETVLFEDIATTTTNDVSNGVTNGIPPEVPPIEGERFVRQSTSATLTETIVNVTARLDYTAPNWFVFAGLSAEPWSDTDLQATIEVDNERIPLSFTRRHPFSGYVGAGFTYQDVHSYLELEAGGVNAIRLGVMLSF